MFNTIRKKMCVDSIVYPWNIGLSCTNCSRQFTVTRTKKICMFCKSSYCTVCIERRPDKRLSCRKCLVLMARPIDRSQLFNLKSRDLVEFLSSHHISTTDCIEKEDLVNAVMRSVNSTGHMRRSSSGSYPGTPRRPSVPLPMSMSGSRSQDDLYAADGIRVTGMDSASSWAAASPTSEGCPFVLVDPADIETPQPHSTIAPEPQKWIELSDIDDLQQLEALTIRQLKELLGYNRIDYSGCVERSELMQKAQRLWCDYVQSRKEVATLDTSDLCKICMDAPIECVLLECGHYATCIKCGKQLAECPICRQLVVRCVRTFKV